MSLGATEIAHPGHGGNMFTHLTRVESLLREWGEREAVCSAGFLHGLFGPAPLPDGGFYTILPLDERARVVETAGAEVADLVYEYGACDREYTYPRLELSPEPYRDRFTGIAGPLEDRRLRDFLAITAANEVDQGRESTEFVEMHGAFFMELFTRCRSLLSDGAWEACVDTFAGESR
ncbi:DUF6817 domain-containing protein [Nocardia sp. NPDC051030]|uniref:DUF6817 domain-containing protein n=1 Tax=Nocardia sp. NPDC051030 TaxID=3155162 RepID=UPI003434CB7C